MENAIAVANYFIGRGLESGIEVTPMKAIKLVYIAHGWYLGIYKKPLLEDGVQAWQYGPVIKQVYDEFKKYGSAPITKKGTTGFFLNPDTPEVASPETRDFLAAIWERYGMYTGIQLSSLTHQTGTPWDIIWNSWGKHELFALIPNDLIQEHYQSLINVRTSPQPTSSVVA